MAQVLCQWCQVKDDKERQIKGVHPKGYIHIDCIPAYEKHKEFLKKDQEEKDELYYYITELFNFKKTTDIPPLFYQKIEDLRNDNWVLGKFNKKYKEGVRYSGILYGYKYCEEKIRAAIIKLRDENANALSILTYCLAIVRNSLPDAYNHAKRDARQKQQNEKIINEANKTVQIQQRVREIQSAPEKQDKIDLTTLLD